MKSIVARCVMSRRVAGRPAWRGLSTGLAPIAVIAAIGLLLGGCGGAGYAEVPVSGVITYNDKPLSGVHITFQPVAEDKAGFAPGSFGRSDEQGRFEMRTVYPDAPGAIPGVHRVQVSYEDPTTQPPDVNIPEDYRTGEATFTVPAEGTDQAVIALTSRR